MPINTTRYAEWIRLDDSEILHVDVRFEDCASLLPFLRACNLQFDCTEIESRGEDILSGNNRRPSSCRSIAIRCDQPANTIATGLESRRLASRCNRSFKEALPPCPINVKMGNRLTWPVRRSGTDESCMRNPVPHGSGKTARRNAQGPLARRRSGYRCRFYFAGTGTHPKGRFVLAAGRSPTVAA